MSSSVDTIFKIGQVAGAAALITTNPNDGIAAQLTSELGKLRFVDGKGYRLCKAGADITTAPKKVLVSAISSGQPTWVVSLGGASTAYIQKWRVVVPSNQVGSGSTSTTLVTGDYFYGQVSGPCTLLSNAAITAGGSLLLVAMSTGKVKAATLTTAVVAAASIGFNTATANATAADVTIGACLKGLI